MCVPLRTLEPGAGFRCPWNGATGRVVRHSLDRTAVRIDGQAEAVGWGSDTAVEPLGAKVEV